MLCGGITVYSPLVANGAGPSKRVGIIGLGGLGQFGVQYAKALGCKEIVAICRTSEKEADAIAIGATKFIATNEEPAWEVQNSRSLDLIICTVSSPKMPVIGYLKLLRASGKFIQVGAPEGDYPSFSAFALVAKGVKIGGSAIGSLRQIKEMLDLSAKAGVHPCITKRPMNEIHNAVQEMVDGSATYRYVLYNENSTVS